jgi:hypothetical protein
MSAPIGNRLVQSGLRDSALFFQQPPAMPQVIKLDLSGSILPSG